MARNDICPSRLMNMMGEKTNRNRFRNTYLTEEFLAVKIGRVHTFSTVYLPKGAMQTDRQRRFMTPQDDSRNSIVNSKEEKDAEILAENITTEILRGLSENSRKEELCEKIDWTKLLVENNSYRISKECLEDIASVNDKADKFMILLIFAIFQKHYVPCGIRNKVHAYLRTLDSAWRLVEDLSGSHLYQSLCRMKLKPGFEGDYYMEWSNPMFLEEDEADFASLGKNYVLPSYKEDGTVKNNLMDYMARIIENKDHKNQISLILGGPGAGKTTLFSRFLNSDNGGVGDVTVRYEEDEAVCIYRGKKRIFLYRFNRLPEEIWRNEDGTREASADEVGERLLRRIHADKVEDLKNTILLLDGFDECPASKEMRSGLMTVFAEKWGRYARIFITCRYHYISNINEISRKVSCISLQPFDWEHIRVFICKYKNWNPDSEETEERIKPYWNVMEKKEDMNSLFREESDEKEDISNIYGIPIILYMVLAMDDSIQLDASTTTGMVYNQIFREDKGIYDRMIQKKYYDPNTAGGGGLGIFLKDDEIRKLYKNRLVQISHEIAHYMFRENCYQNAIKKDVEELYNRTFEAFTDSSGNIVDFGKILSSGLFMIVDTPEKGSDTDSTIRFVHKSMYEYFVAEYIYSVISMFYQNGEEQELHVKLVYLLKDSCLSAEIGEYLQQKLKEDKNIDFEKFERFAEGLLWRGIHTYEKEEEGITLADVDRIRWQKISEERQVFENLIYILQLFRTAKGIKDGKTLLFKNCVFAKRSLLEYLKKGHYEGPNGVPFDLSFVDLAGINLDHVDLSYYNLSGADARNTSFRKARLDFCNLTGAKLNDAALAGASLWQTTPSANELFDTPENEIPWTDFEGYLSTPYDFSKDSAYQTGGEFLGVYRFGKYPMGVDGSKDDILWDILEVRGNRALLISQKILDVIPYNNDYVETNWAECSLRRWLQEDFCKKAEFTAKEKQRICRTLVEPYANIDEDYKTNQGKASIDELWLLSGQELVKYYAEKNPRKDDWWYHIQGRETRARGTLYAKKKGLGVSMNGNGDWWLRSVGFSGLYAMLVDDAGDVDSLGNLVPNDYVGVRPALWVILKS